MLCVIATTRWHEAWLSTPPPVPPAPSQLGQLVQRGDLVLCLPDVATADECAMLERAALEQADALQQRRFETGLDPEGRTRLPTAAAARRAATSGTPCAEPLSLTADEACSRVLRRTLRRIDETLPSLVVTLFDAADGSGGGLLSLLKADALEFSSREPAVNVYTDGGEFLAHKDHQALTVLVPLSAPDAFGGGGTGFWAQDARGHRVEAPTAVLRPPAGTALLFGGGVVHCGMPVEEGSRVVFVASFSLRGGRRERAAADLRSRDIYGDLL